MKICLILFFLFFPIRSLRAEMLDDLNYRLVPKGQVIYEVGTKKALRIDENIIVKVEQYIEDDDFIVISSKKDNIKYLVHFSSLENLNPILDMQRSPHFYEEVEYKEKKSQIIKKFSIDQSFNISSGITAVSFVRERPAETAINNNLNYQVFFNTKRSWTIGANLNWENTKSLASSDSFSFNSLSFGPSLKFNKFFNNWDWILRVNQGFSTVLDAKDEGTLRLNQTTFTTSWITEKEYQMGHFRWGLNASLSKLKFKDSNSSGSFTGRLDTHLAFGIMVGHGFY